MAKIKELPKEERPYEKCLAKGAGALSDSELLAIILRCGGKGRNSLLIANEILKLSGERYAGLLGLHHLTVEELKKIKGVGEVKAVQMKCIGELSKRMSQLRAAGRLSFQNPATIAEYYMEQLRHEEQEQLFCMMLDTKNHLLGERLLTKGTVNESMVSPRELFLEALRYQAVNIILIHNHPSGDPTPSRADTEVTARVYRVGELLGIHLLDHIVIGDHKYVSMREENILG